MHLQRLVDWSKPMLSQVGKLGPQYKAWVSVPVDRKLRLFSWDILEYMTVTPWYLIPIVWIPVFMFFIYRGWLTNQQEINGKVTATITVCNLDKAKIHFVAFWDMTPCSLVAEYRQQVTIGSSETLKPTYQTTSATIHNSTIFVSMWHVTVKISNRK